jgi:capsular polysaccharide transport system ATP-binding protein
MIEFRNVVKADQTGGMTKWVLRGGSFVFPRHRSIGILGPNGAGKSTLIRMIAGAEKPDHGSIRRTVRVSWPLGFAGGIAGGMTGQDACVFVARLYGEDQRRVTRFVADFAELGPYFYEPTSTYSSGMKARLSFGLSMSIDFDVYLVDEITAVGDARFRRNCLEAFRKRRETADVIMVSHSIGTIRDYCDMGAVLADGTLRFYDDIEEAIAVYSEQVIGVPVK